MMHWYCFIKQVMELQAKNWYSSLNFSERCCYSKVFKVCYGNIQGYKKTLFEINLVVLLYLDFLIKNYYSNITNY